MALPVVVKWNGKEIPFDLGPEDTIETLKHKLQEETMVQMKRQKLLGLKTKAGKPAQDNVKISDLALKPGTKVMMMGTPEAVIQQTAAEAEKAPEIQDDLDLTPEAEQQLALENRPEIQEKLARRIASVNVEVLHPPREGKKCLVLDIDYTLFDLDSNAERPEELARPYLHEFLTAAYPYYDIIIWSATGKKWVDVKMKELGVSTHEAYKLTCMLDYSSMLTVHTEKYGVFDCKPLAFIWAKFPDHYNSTNTIMFDDLRRNYILNRQNGLVIRPYRKAHLNRHTDQELKYLTRYLLAIADLRDLSHLDHRSWEQYIRGNR